MGAKPLTVAVDASPLIGLAKIRKLRLLAKLYPVVVILPAVYADVVVRGAGRAGARAVKQAVADGWIRVVTPDDSTRIPPALRGTGEGEVIALVLCQQADVAIVDDRKARNLCNLLGIRHISTGSVLKDAASQGLIRDLAKTLHRLQQKGFGIFDYAQLVEGND
jgi:predicted nucleic acid-binding protein